MERICKVCSVKFDISPAFVARGGGLYCSRKCKDKAQSIRMKAEQPENHPHWQGGKIEKQCLGCGKSILVKRCMQDKDSFCSKSCANSYHSKNRAKKGIILQCKVCGGNFYRVQSAVSRIDKKPLYCSQRCRAIDSIKNQRKQNTDIEAIVENWLIEKAVVYEKQEDIEGIALVDFIVNSEVCIFADGDYWHSKPARIKVDRRQTKQLIANGYTVIRLKGSDILLGKFKEQLCNIMR